MAETGGFLKGLARGGLNAVLSAAAGTPNVLENEISKVESSRDAKKLRALNLERGKFELDQRRNLAPLELSREEQAIESGGIKLGFLKDKVKRRRALEDAVLLDLAKDDVEEQKKILRKRILNETRLNPKVDLTDTMTALELLNKDRLAFNKGVQRTIKIGQLFGDIPTPPAEVDRRTPLERNAALASTPEGFQAIRNLEQAKTLEKQKEEKSRTFGKPQQFLVNGKPQLLDRDPQTGAFVDLQGNPVDPASIQELPKSTQRVLDKDGNVVFEQGPGLTGGQVSKPTKTELEKKLTNNLATQARLERVSDQFQNEFLTFKGKALNSVFAFLDKLQIDELKDMPLVGKLFDGLDAEQKKAVREFSAFHRNVQEAFAQFGKSISGAAISEQEFKRLEKAFINAKQSPEQFKAVLEETLSTFERSNRIYQSLIDRGLDPFTKEGGKAFDDLFVPGKGQSGLERASDLNEALKSQIPDPKQRSEAVMEILESEGFQLGK